MATYLMLINYTDAGIQHFKSIGERLAHARHGAAELGATLVSFYLTMGEYDAVAVLEAPNDEVLVASAYFSDFQILRALEAAAGRGARVRVHEP